MTKPMTLPAVADLAMAAAEEVQGDVAQANAFLAVAKLLATNGDVARAAPVLDRGLDLCHGLEPADRAYCLARAMVPAARIDPARIAALAEEAFTAAQQTDLAKYVLPPICRALARLGAVDVAVRGLICFSDRERQDAVSLMITDLLRAGDEASARRLIPLLADREEAAACERDCIMALAAAGRMDEALLRTAKLDDPLQRCLAYVDLYGHQNTAAH